MYWIKILFIFITFEYLTYIKNNVAGVKNVVINQLVANRDNEVVGYDMLQDNGIYTTKAGYCKFDETNSLITMAQYT